MNNKIHSKVVKKYLDCGTQRPRSPYCCKSEEWRLVNELCG